MNTKYRLDENDTVIAFNGAKLFRIICVTAFASIAADERGGYIEKESCVAVHGNAWVYGDARVFGNARVYGNARVFGNAWVYGDAQVFGNAQVYGNARVFGDARVFGNAQVYGNARVKFGHCTFNCALPENAMKILLVTFDLCPVNGMIRLFKRIHADWSSLYDSEFLYPRSGKIECKGQLDYSLSCGPGMHWSTATYWGNGGDMLIAADIPVSSILAIAEGKVRCSEAYILGKVDE